MKNHLKTCIFAIGEGYRQRKLLLYGTNLLARLGLQIMPYYLTIESDQEKDIKLPSKLEAVVCSFITPAQIEQIYHHSETKDFALLEKYFPDDTFLCFALTQNQEIMAFMWCNLTRSHWEADPFNLKQDEAYLFNAYTYKKYRGMNLSPYLRRQLYKALSEIGRTRLYSHTEYFNTPAINFKKKLGCKHVKLALYLKLFFKFKRNIIIEQDQFSELDNI